MNTGRNYTELMREQFGLNPIAYFVSCPGVKFDVEDQYKYMMHVEELRQKYGMKSITENFEHPLITVVLFVDQNKECEIKAMSIRSRRDKFDEWEGINTASYYALLHMKNRGVYRVKKPSSIRALINCRMNMTVHSVRNPELDLFELSLVQSKKSLVEDVQEGKVVRDCSVFNVSFKNAMMHKKESLLTRLLHSNPYEKEDHISQLYKKP